MAATALSQCCLIIVSSASLFPQSTATPRRHAPDVLHAGCKRPACPSVFFPRSRPPSTCSPAWPTSSPNRRRSRCCRRRRRALPAPRPSTCCTTESWTCLLRSGSSCRPGRGFDFTSRRKLLLSSKPSGASAGNSGSPWLSQPPLSALRFGPGRGACRRRRGTSRCLASTTLYRLHPSTWPSRKRWLQGAPLQSSNRYRRWHSLATVLLQQEATRHNPAAFRLPATTAERRQRRGSRRSSCAGAAGRCGSAGRSARGRRGRRGTSRSAVPLPAVEEVPQQQGREGAAAAPER